MDLGLQGKVALVTGVSQGIGLATAVSLLAEGAKVLGTSRSAPPPLEGMVHLAVDMAGPEAGDRAVAAAVDRFGQLDIVVNNVGSARIGTGFVSESDADWHEFLELNLMSMVRTTRSALSHLAARGGVVVNVSSINGHLPSTGIYSYGATKAAMDNLTVALSQEYAPQGVRVVGVAPGPVETPLWLGPTGVAAMASALSGEDPKAIVAEAIRGIPLGRFSSAQEVGDLITFLASPRAGSITGTTVTVDGGITPTT